MRVVRSQGKSGGMNSASDGGDEVIKFADGGQNSGLARSESDNFRPQPDGTREGYDLDVPAGFLAPEQFTEVEAILRVNKYELNLLKGQFLGNQEVVITTRLNNPHITTRGPPEFILVITTDKAILERMEGKVSAVNLGQLISKDYPENTVFIHPYFFSLPSIIQEDILRHELEELKTGSHQAACQVSYEYFKNNPEELKEYLGTLIVLFIKHAFDDAYKQESNLEELRSIFKLFSSTLLYFYIREPDQNDVSRVEVLVEHTIGVLKTLIKRNIKIEGMRKDVRFIAGLLHDIGKVIDWAKHEERGDEIMSEVGFVSHLVEEGLIDSAEAMIIKIVARYHQLMGLTYTGESKLLTWQEFFTDERVINYAEQKPGNLSVLIEGIKEISICEVLGYRGFIKQARLDYFNYLADMMMEVDPASPDLIEQLTGLDVRDTPQRIRRLLSWRDKNVDSPFVDYLNEWEEVLKILERNEPFRIILEDNTPFRDVTSLIQQRLPIEEFRLFDTVFPMLAWADGLAQNQEKFAVSLDHFEEVKAGYRVNSNAVKLLAVLLIAGYIFESHSLIKIEGKDGINLEKIEEDQLVMYLFTLNKILYKLKAIKHVGQRILLVDDHGVYASSFIHFDREKGVSTFVVCPSKLNDFEVIEEVTERAALAVVESGLVGSRRDPEEIDKVATAVIRRDLDTIGKEKGILFRVVAGEGEKDEASREAMLYRGEVLGDKNGKIVDVIVDPVDGTSLVAEGKNNAVSAIAAAEEGGLLPLPDYYMLNVVFWADKKVVIDLRNNRIEEQVDSILAKIADANGLQMRELIVLIPGSRRHLTLIEKVKGLGVKEVKIFSKGDILNRIYVGLNKGYVYIGSAGTVETEMDAVALRRYQREDGSGAQLVAVMGSKNAKYEVVKYEGTDKKIYYTPRTEKGKKIEKDNLDNLYKYSEEEVLEMIEMGIDANKQYEIKALVLKDAVFYITPITKDEWFGIPGVADIRKATEEPNTDGGRTKTVKDMEPIHPSLSFTQTEKSKKDGGEELNKILTSVSIHSWHNIFDVAAQQSKLLPNHFEKVLFVFEFLPEEVRNRLRSYEVIRGKHTMALEILIPKRRTSQENAIIIKYLATVLNNYTMTLGPRKIYMVGAEDLFNSLRIKLEKDFKQVFDAVGDFYGKEAVPEYISRASAIQKIGEDILPSTLPFTPTKSLFNPNWGTIVGIDIGGSNIKGVVIVNGEIKLKMQTSTFPPGTEKEDSKDFVLRVENFIRELM